MTNRYQTTGAEGEFEPGSNGQVLRNLVGITSADDMDELELRLLGELYDEVLLQDFPDRALTVEDLKRWHHQWLGNVYPWAGQERSVNLGKGGFQFATAGPALGFRAAIPGKVDILLATRPRRGCERHRGDPCGTGLDSSVPRGQWALGPSAGRCDGRAGWP